MCGIAGLFDTRGKRDFERALMQRMNDVQHHRGPDEGGYHFEPGVALAHRRLSIIDLATGQQPLFNEDGSVAVVFNGEIYNFQELRGELKALGYQFVSRTDSEVLLYAFAAWGIDCVHRLNGMFAFAVWDCVTRTLTLARDRYGIKPLYYAVQGECLYFGSEVKALLAHSGFSTGVDPEALVEYFTFQNFLSARTLYQGVSILPAASYLQVAPGLQVPEPSAYWDFDFKEPQAPGDPREYAEELDGLFSQAVNRMLIADVDLGAYLSGGLDSGSITALAARQLPFIRTFTVGFDLTSASGLELALDERPAAERLSYLFRTEHYEMVLKAGDMERCHRDLVRHIEEPRVGQSYPNWYAAKLASRFVKVVLAGTGGDELFGGYPWRYLSALGGGDFEGFVDRYFGFWNRLIPQGQLAAVFGPIWKDVGHLDTRATMRGVFPYQGGGALRPEDYVNQALYFEAKTFLHGLLVIDDKLSMAHGLETRLPFLDNDLVDFAQRVPVALKLRGLTSDVLINENDPIKPQKQIQKTNNGKLLLRQAMARLVPPDTLGRVKQGFMAPDASWFKGESIEFVKAKILSPRALIYQYMDRRTVTALVEDHLSGRTNRRLFIWSLLVFEEWLAQLAV